MLKYMRAIFGLKLLSLKSTTYAYAFYIEEEPSVTSSYLIESAF